MPVSGAGEGAGAGGGRQPVAVPLAQSTGNVMVPLAAEEDSESAAMKRPRERGGSSQ